MKRSIRTRFTVIFLAIIMVILMFIWCLNTWGLEGFYLWQKVRDIEDAYGRINTTVMTAQSENMSIISDDSENNEATVVLKEILEEYSNKFNVTIAIIDSSTNRSLLTTERDGDFLLKRAQAYLFNPNTENKIKIVKQTDNYSIINSLRMESNTSFLEFFGYCEDNQTVVIMSTPMSNLKESVLLSNKFLTFIGCIACLLCLIVVFFMTKQITKPILKIAALSKRMGELDFEAHYDEEREDEIGVLGTNMNIMADKLQETITKLKNANVELKADIEKKEKVDEMRIEFIANVSHELKTPIALIQGYAEGLGEGLCEDEESRKYYTNVIVDETNKMSSMVRQLLTLSSLETDSRNISIERFNLTELIEGVINATKILAEDTVRFEFDDSSAIYAWGDEFKIEEVITNYVSNAIHHVDAGGTVRVSTELIKEADRVRVSVFNSGSHIPQEDIEHIWDKFYKVDKAHSRTYGGSGIGLSIVRAVMESHSMPYGADNTDDGVVFWFELDTRNS